MGNVSTKTYRLLYFTRVIFHDAWYLMQIFCWSFLISQYLENTDKKGFPLQIRNDSGLRDNRVVRDN